MRTMPAGEFKAKCLAVMDEVQATGQPVILTKRGKVIAWLTPPPGDALKQPSVDSIFGSLRGAASIVGDPDTWIDPIIPEEEWDHLKPDWSLFPAE
jgi:prevent-host-death family protein